MDHESFDRFVRLLGGSGSRRTALGALLAGALGGTAVDAAAKGKGKGKGRHKDRDRKRDQRRDKAKQRQGESGESPAVSTQAADCFSIGPSSNMNGCDFSGMDLSGRDLSGSSMRGTKFTSANLCGANLSSSTLTNADFRGANLTRAALKSSACRGALFDAATTFCQTRTCTGTVRSDDCPGVPADNVCCSTGDCAERTCRAGTCHGERCAYATQPDGQAGTLCPAPGQCCDGGCCAEGQTCCGETCTNTKTDDDNCGTCGNACPTGSTCQNGACSEPPPICIEALQACVPGQEPACCEGRTCQTFQPGCWGPVYCCRKRGEPCSNACDCCSTACLHSGGTATCL
jgi:hypothetical protein